MVAHCIGCGCTQSMACADCMGAPCFWVETSDDGCGICSECCEASGWISQHFGPAPDFTIRRFTELFAGIYDADEVRRWFDLPQKLLDGKTPRELVLTRRIAEVRVVIEQLRSGAYL